MPACCHVITINVINVVVVVVAIIVGRFYIALFSSLEKTHSARIMGVKYT